MEASPDAKSVHSLLADLVLGGPAETVIDLGAGSGDTLAEIRARAPVGRLAAVDVDENALAKVVVRIPGTHGVQHDVAAPLPFGDETFDVVVSHNMLECVREPAALLAEIGRILRPGGRAILGHTDFETVLVTIEDRDLARRVLRTYAELPVRYRHMATCDPWMGRRLAGLVRNSRLSLESVRAFVTVHTNLPDAAEVRLEEVAAAARQAAARGLGYVTPEEVEHWRDQLRAADETGHFLFSETAFVVTATRLTEV
ncbi:methyltransferase family protein [Frankia sp. EI5c]|uniref:methyltransferase domain-containing protein n=1 Tax=Frankia sp. EI5c TaxID=683316 RepID=UPI0007C24939|nr:methyltransferase domain-containing protein [Frankia sp. EI5c]OAA29605.1 methyltransferase family protein [Frankia sp. EI5c]